MVSCFELPGWRSSRAFWRLGCSGVLMGGRLVIARSRRGFRVMMGLDVFEYLAWVWVARWVVWIGWVG